MSLIVVPLGGPDGSPVALEPLVELGSLVALDRDGRAPEVARGLESLRIVPLDAERWTGEPTRALVERGLLLAPLPEPPPDARQDDRPTFAARLEQAVEACLHDLARAPGQDGGLPVVLVVPVAVLPEAAADPADPAAATAAAAAAAEELTAVWAALDALVGGAGAGTGGGGLSFGDFRVIPWVFCDDGAGRLPEPFFRGPGRLGAQGVAPIVHGGRIRRGGARVRWSGHGEARLLTELLALLALSADRDALARLLPRTDGARSHVRLHSALFEYPFDDLLRESVLAKLRSDRPGRGRLLPAPSELPLLLGAAERQRTQDDAAERLAGLREVVERDEAPEDALSFAAGGERHGLPPVRFDVAPRREDLADVGLTRRADRLHTRFFEALVRRSEDPFERLVDAAIRAAGERTEQESAELERALARAFTRADDGRPTATAAESSAAAAARAAALGDALSTGLGAMGARLETLRPEQPERILEDARAVRAAWVAEEEDLLRAAVRLPTPRGIAVHGAAVGIGAALAVYAALVLVGLFAGWSTTTRASLALVLGMGAAALFAWTRVRRVRDYLARWEAFVRSARATADTHARRLVRVINHRLRLIKYGATQSLQSRLQAARDRFQIELGGFARLVDDELSARSRRRQARRDADALQPPEDVGRFRVAVEEQASPVESAVVIPEARFHDRLVTTVGATLRLRDLPARTPVGDYRAILHDLAASAARDAAAAEKLLQEQAAATLARAVRYGSDPQLMPRSGGEPLGGEQRCVLLGATLQTRLPAAAGGELPAPPGGGAPPPAPSRAESVTRSLPAELAVALVAASFRTTDGRTTDGRTTDGRTTDGRTTDGRTTDGRTTDGRTTDGRTTDGRTTDGRTTDDRTTDGRTTDGRTTGAEEGGHV